MKNTLLPMLLLALVACDHDSTAEPDAARLALDTGTSEPDGAPPAPDAADQEPDAVTQEPDAATPEPDAANPEPDAANPAPDAADQEPDVAVPEPDAAAQEPDASTLDPACRQWQHVTDDQLYAALHAELHRTYRDIEPAEDLGGNLNRYTTARHIMFTEIERAQGPDGNLGVECVYTGRFTPTGPDEEPDHADVNCEHVWPRARMDPDRDSALYHHQQSDIHHLYPTDSGANSTRGSDPFGEPISDLNLDRLPATAGLNEDGHRVFAPRQERRGDIARAVFYFSMRWGTDIAVSEEAVLRAWAQADPVDDRERTRNDRVEAAQGNRNPFVDCPTIIGRIPDFESFDILDHDLPLP